MAFFSMRHDFRAPAFAPASSQEIYATALEQFAWADEQRLRLARALRAPRRRRRLDARAAHDGGRGARPAPRSARLMISAAILPLHDPIRIAEQIAVLDNAFPGRTWIVFGAGYRVEEFEMAGLEHAARGRVLEEHVATVLEALAGEPFEWRGREVRVTPKPVTDPRRMLFVGGGVPAAGAARGPAAARDVPDERRCGGARGVLRRGARRSVSTGGFVLQPVGPTFVHVADDPEKAWAEIGKYVLYEAQTYASFQTPGQHSTPGVHADVGRRPEGVAAVRRRHARRRARPAASGAGATAASCSTRSRAGSRPRSAWSSLELFAAKVLPRLRPSTSG